MRPRLTTFIATVLLLVLIIFTGSIPIQSQDGNLNPLPLPPIVNPEATAEISPIPSDEISAPLGPTEVPSLPSYNFQRPISPAAEGRDVEPLPITGQTKYIFIPQGNSNKLQQAVNVANFDLNNTYVIFLAEGTYEIPPSNVPAGSTYAIGSRGNVILRGMDNYTYFMPAQATIQRTQNSSTQYGLIAVTERSFTVYNIRIRYGNAPVAGGGIVIYPGASAYIFDSKLNNNVANSSTGQGGGVYNRGKLIITNGQFNGNTAKVGGAVASYLATTRVRQGDYGTWCALFKSNSVSVNAGGVYSQDSTTKVQRSMFSANSAPSSAYRDIENSPASLPGNIVVADQSWWNGSISVSPSVSTNGSMLGSTIPGLNCAVANPPAPTLADYGIETNATSPQDLQAILAGVHKTGVALWRSFGQDGTPLDSSIDAFKRVMYGPGRSKLQINIGGSGSVCVTNNNNVPLPYQAIITCPPTPSVILSEWTVAHELGHVLVARTGGYNANDPNGKTSFFRHMLVTKIVDPANQNLVIFGDVNGTDWGRGNRGWGSSSINQSSGAPCNFQQNPLSIPNTRTPQEVDEGAADMFLNWVYRKNKSDEGFKNVDWSSFTSCQITGAIELLPSASGDLRFSRMEQVIQMMGTDRGW